MPRRLLFSPSSFSPPRRELDELEDIQIEYTRYAKQGLKGRIGAALLELGIVAHGKSRLVRHVLLRELHRLPARPNRRAYIGHQVFE